MWMLYDGAVCVDVALKKGPGRPMGITKRRDMVLARRVPQQVWGDWPVSTPNKQIVYGE